MPMSPYVRDLRARVGHDLLLLPGVTAIIRNGDRFLLVRQRGSELWGLVGGGVEPGEEPQDAVAREIAEELGLDSVVVRRIVGAYGGADLVTEYPNGDRVSYVTIAYECELPPMAEISFADHELVEARWFSEADAALIPTRPWVDRILQDVVRSR
ncbi:NUDIX domain-containing protein [Microbacterium sp. SA39]|uniref:NUDIX domain-containing protein n=1 Tax=Microbacterium sp. SA39 TaxID=1263625 RepID=UPI0005F9DEBD|nr:NUDIX domain-containing protein [Microbacterium sp. SA39]KJQ53138.1 NADH pyrophosphatase [Microbacterium sp. SA39]